MVGCVHLNTNHRARQLHVGNITTSTRVNHHRDTGVHVCQLVFQECCNLIVNVSPCANRQVVSLFLSNQTLVELLRNQSRLSITFSHKLRNFLKVDVVGHTSRHSRNRSKAESLTLHAVCDLSGFFGAVLVKDLRQHLLKLLFSLDIVIVWEIFRQNLIEEDATQSCFTHFTFRKDTNWGLQVNYAIVVSHFCFVNRAVSFNFVSLSLRLVVSQVIVTKHDVLRNVQHWRTISGLQQVGSCAHQFASLSLSLF